MPESLTSVTFVLNIFNMDNGTIIKMLLASQNENEKLHARLGKIYVEVKDWPRYNIEKVTWKAR